MPLQEAYMPGGGRHHYPVQMHTLSVGEEPDIVSVKVQPAAVTLHPGESKKIEVTLQRRPGFKGSVTLATIYQHLGNVFGSSMPPGVSVDERTSKTLLSGDETHGVITLTAAADAQPVQMQQIPIMAHVSINFVVKYTYCSAPVLVSVTKGKK
jgi:hypothetical protein